MTGCRPDSMQFQQSLPTEQFLLVAVKAGMEKGFVSAEIMVWAVMKLFP
jgi:hypothetical protein